MDGGTPETVALSRCCVYVYTWCGRCGRRFHRPSPGVRTERVYHAARRLMRRWPQEIRTLVRGELGEVECLAEQRVSRAGGCTETAPRSELSVMSDARVPCDAILNRAKLL